MFQYLHGIVIHDSFVDSSFQYLHGIVSWGSKRCDSSHRYTVFTRVTHFLPWIAAHTDSGQSSVYYDLKINKRYSYRVQVLFRLEGGRKLPLATGKCHGPQKFVLARGHIFQIGICRLLIQVQPIKDEASFVHLLHEVERKYYQNFQFLLIVWLKDSYNHTFYQVVKAIWPTIHECI